MKLMIKMELIDISVLSKFYFVIQLGQLLEQL